MYRKFRKDVKFNALVANLADIDVLNVNLLNLGQINYISQSSFNPNGSDSFTINKPGYYCLRGDVEYKPTTTGTCAISITSSDVILDLGIYTLKQGNTTALTHGICVERDVSRVTICGVENVAQILDFTLAGIRVYGRTSDITIEGLIVNQSELRELLPENAPVACEDIINMVLTNGIVVGEGDTGYIEFKDTDLNNHVTNLNILDVVVKKCMYGIHIVFTFGFKVDNVLLTENSMRGILCGNTWLIPSDGPEDPTIPGNGLVAFPVVSNGYLNNVRADRNIGQNLDLVVSILGLLITIVSGIAFYSAQDCKIENSSASDNHNDGYILAVDHDGSMGMVWENCVFNNNSSDTTRCDGFHMSGSIPFFAFVQGCTDIEYPFLQNYNTVIKNCVANGNYGYQGVGFGFTETSGLTIENCVAEGNYAIDGGYCSGFWYNGNAYGGLSASSTFTRCTVQRNGFLNEGYSAGFTIGGLTQNVIINECIINENGKLGDTGNPFLTTGGIFVGVPYNPQSSTGPEIKNIVIKNNIINDNGTSNTQYASGGVIILRDWEEIDIQNVLIDNNTITNSNGDGIVVFNNTLYPPGDILGVIIKNNEIDQCTGTGINVALGGTSIMVLGNIAIGNGGNYDGVTGVDIIDATTGTLPDTVGLKNVSITF